MHTLLLLAGTALARSTHALVIGVSGYASFPALHADHDVARLSRVLVEQGAEERSVHILADQVATGARGTRLPGVPDRATMLEALDALARRVAPGDAAVLHFSGHGVQVRDDGDDETDGYDEALVPIDGTSDAATLVRDDELRVRIDAIRRQLGPTGHLLVTVDSCHSGTATRGGRTARGGLPPIGDSARGASARPDRGPELEQDASTGLAPYVLIAAAQSNERSEEVVGPDGVAMGALSRALSTLIPAAAGRADYGALTEDVRRAFRAEGLAQRPQIEGDPARAVLSGQPVWRPAAVRVSRSNGTELTLEGGELHGYTAGSRVAILPVGARVEAGQRPVAHGTVARASPASSVVQLDGTPVESLAGSLAALSEVKPSPRALTVALPGSMLGGEADAALVRAGVASSALVTLATGADADITLLEGLPLRIRARDGTVRPLLLAGRPPRTPKEVVSALQIEGRRAVLERSTFDDPMLDLVVEVGHGLTSGDTCTWVREATRADPLRAGVDRCAIVRVRNRGIVPARFVLFNLPPEGGLIALRRPGRERITEEDLGAERTYDIPLNVGTAAVEPLVLLTLTRPISPEEERLLVSEEPPLWGSGTRGAPAAGNGTFELSRWEFRVEPAR